jgi:nicotinate-nucleotide pyrophosphorylase (carboxylating)
VKAANREGLPVEVEVRDLDEFDEALRLGVDRILLDNMPLAEMGEAVRRARGKGEEARPELEASGNVTLERIGEIAATGVDLVSVGALTHSAPAVDLSLLVEGVEGGGS